jgi:hypothetical protein
MAEERSWLRIRDDMGRPIVAQNGGGVSLFFWRGGVSRFCRGFCKKRGAERGFLMVKSWWNAGERWSENDLKLASKNMPLF